MAESKELKQIKKIYGEKFMHLCRELFPTILEKEGLLTEILTSTFAANSKTLYEDITSEGLEEEFKSLIFSNVDVEKKEIEIVENKTPYELLEEAGYDLYECNSEDEIQSFKKYYEPGEELCTFRGGRLDRCVVFWAVKKDANKILRKDFDNPKREDEYGTSVMGIQFTKTENSTVSIKNRYNHTVNNPDATYGNDLDRIVPGLTKSFGKLLAERDLKLDNSNIEIFELPGYTVANDGKYYKYNMEIGAIYFCPGNIIIDTGEVKQLEPEKQILIDYFVLDKENKTIDLYNNQSFFSDSFIDGLKNIEKIEVTKNDEKEKGNRTITIKAENNDNPIKIEIDRDNNIVGYKNENIQSIGNNFLCSNIKLNQLELPNLTKVENCFMTRNNELSQLNLPKLAEVGNSFIKVNYKISHINLPQLTKVGRDFLADNIQLTQLDLPELTEVGFNFIGANREISHINLPQLTEAGDLFLADNKQLTQLNLPNLRTVRDYFISENKKISQLQLPNLEEVGNNFLGENRKIETVELPNLKKIEDNFLASNQQLNYIKLPNLEEIGNGFLKRIYNSRLDIIINIPKMPEIKKQFKDNQNYKTNYINSRDIAAIDKENSLTTTEISLGKRIIERIKNLFRGKEQNQR